MHFELSNEFDVEMEKMREVIFDFASHQDYVPDVLSSVVLYSDDKVFEVEYTVNLFTKITYKVRLECNGKGVVRWELISSDLFSLNEGMWRLSRLKNGGVRVDYIVDVQFKVPVPGFWVNRILKKNIPKMVNALYERACSL